MIGSAMEASQTTVEQLTRKYCSMGRFDLAFEVEHHDELANLTLDWLFAVKSRRCRRVRFISNFALNGAHGGILNQAFGWASLKTATGQRRKL